MPPARRGCVSGPGERSRVCRVARCGRTNSDEPVAGSRHDEEDEASMAHEVDETDRDLLQLLIDNARIPADVLARELEIDSSEVERRITRMEDLGIIKAYKAVIDPYMYSQYFYENGPLGLRAQHPKP